jgi:lipid A 3-O-deacylase
MISWTQRFYRPLLRRCFWLILGIAIPGLSLAQSFEIESAGARFGSSLASRIDDFYQAEAFSNWNLPWGWDLGRKWFLQSRLDVSVGWLGESGHDAALGTLGPTVLLSREHFPLSIEGGSSPTLLSRHNFGAADLGSDFQFTSHAGLNADLSAHWRLGYRFQHMSNAGLATFNPGLNLHLFAVSYLF